MLVLTRRPGEAIVIGDGIVVRLVEVEGNKVRLAVQAPRSIRVDREEVRERIAAQEAEPLPSDVLACVVW